MDVKRKIWMRALSVFLATLMVIQILPLNAFAKDVVQKSNGNNYMDTVINKQSGAATMYDIKPSSSPYKIGE